MGMNYRNIAIGHCISTTARWRLGFATILIGLSLTLSACSIVLVAPYDEAAVSRITEISKSVLKFYDDLLALPGEKRHAAVTGPLKPRCGEIETLMRVHLLREKARDKNDEGEKIAQNLLDAWKTFGTTHAGSDTSLLSDTALDIERKIFERHLISAFTSEEARKLGTKAK